MIDTDRYRVHAGARPSLADIPSNDDGGLDKDKARQHTDQLLERLNDLQRVLWAGHRYAVLIVLQAMDTGGKDNTIRRVLGPLNPQGVRVWNFKAPTALELGHDFLWRIHKRVPTKGRIGLFNRSHYEDVLIVRVRNLVPKSVWSGRYEHINAFERLLDAEGVRIVKFYLHISPEYQKARLQRRLDRPDKRWKFNPDDLAERALWPQYREAYEEALARCSTLHAPWYVVPAERRWFRDLLVAQVLVDLLESLEMTYPEPDYDPSVIDIE